MRKIVGYIVSNDYGALGLSDYGDGVMVLTQGDGAYVFADRRAARTAIKRTDAYADSRVLSWSRRHRITRLVMDTPTSRRPAKRPR